MAKMDVPNPEGGDLRDSILFQLEEYVPVPAGDAVFDYKVIGESATQQRVSQRRRVRSFAKRNYRIHVLV